MIDRQGSGSTKNEPIETTLYALAQEPSDTILRRSSRPHRQGCLRSEKVAPPQPPSGQRSPTPPHLRPSTRRRRREARLHHTREGTAAAVSPWDLHGGDLHCDKGGERAGVWSRVMPRGHRLSRLGHL